MLRVRVAALRNPMAGFAPHVVSVVGGPGAGKTRLVRSLGEALETYDAYPAAPANWRTSLSALFRNAMAAARNSAEGRGSVLDGSIACELLLVDLDARHGRLTCAHPTRPPSSAQPSNAHTIKDLVPCVRAVGSRAEAKALQLFGASLLRHAPAPDVVIHLDASPAACLERAKATAALALDDLELIGNGTRSVVSAMADKGCEVYVRKWNNFGKTNATRDAILCAPPRPSNRPLARAPPSAAAVEGILQDAWAAAQCAPLQRSPTANLIDPDDADAPPASPSSSVPTAGAMVIQTPSTGACATSREGSPASILTRLEDMPALGDQFAPAA